MRGIYRWSVAVAVLALVLVAAPAGAQSSLLGDVIAARQAYGPTLSRADVGALLNAVAWTHRAAGWGLLSKPTGANCPHAGTAIACDILVHAPSGLHFDVLIDAENVARPTWDNKGPIDLARFLAPIDAGPVTPAPGSTGQTTVSSDVTPGWVPLVARLEALERAVQALNATVPAVEQRVDEARAVAADAAGQADTLAARLAAVADQVAAIAGRPIPIACAAALNLGATRIPISCRLQ